MKGRNLAGKQGLFPQSYTTPARPVTSGPPSQVQSNAASPAKGPDRELPITANGDTKSEHTSSNSMQATMTDVQQAIEQLGHGHNGAIRTIDDAETRSFNSAFTRDTETDFGDGDRNEDGNQGEGQTWHREAREKLALKAEKLVKAAAAQRDAETLLTRSVAPPIDLELSDESEGEDEYDEQNHTRQHTTMLARSIPEEDENTEAVQSTPASKPNILIDSASEPTQTNGVKAPIFYPSETAEIASPHQSAPITQEYLASPQNTTSTSPSRGISPSVLSTTSPTTSVQPSSKHNSASAISQSTFGNQKEKPVLKKATSEWNEAEVVDWLRSKGFGDDVCEKFTEQEITGDVLLELDVNLLKNEIGIPAFGKRMRIANAILDLRRPPSINYSDVGPLSPATPKSAPPAQLIEHAPSVATSRASHSVQSSVHAPALGALMMTDNNAQERPFSEHALDSGKTVGLGLITSSSTNKMVGR